MSSTQRNSDTVVLDGFSLGASESVSRSVEVRGGDKLTGLVDRSTGFQLDIEWLNPDGTVNQTENVLSSSTTGQNEINEEVHFHKANIVVTDTSGSSGSLDLVANMR